MFLKTINMHYGFTSSQLAEMSIEEKMEEVIKRYRTTPDLWGYMVENSKFIFYVFINIL